MGVLSCFSSQYLTVTTGNADRLLGSNTGLYELSYYHCWPTFNSHMIHQAHNGLCLIIS